MSSGLIREQQMRNSMASLHAAMVRSVDNTNIVLEGGLIGMDDAETGGNRNIKGRMARLSEWLEDIHVISAESDFENSFMFPIKKAAEFLSYLRREDVPTSIDMNGLVFAVSSPYYDETVDMERGTVSAIFPCLQSAMHVRVKDMAVTPGWKTFKSVQPIPLINRMNPTRLEIVRLDERPEIAGFDFLKCPLSCVVGFERSLAMENFCEVGSSNTDRPKLGAPLVVCGRVKNINPYRVTISGCDAAESIMTASVSPELGKGFEGRQLQAIKGAWVRMLITAWYHGDGDDEKDRMPPQSHMIEETTKEQAITDEIIGHARMFGSTKMTTLEREYGRIPEHLPLAVIGDEVSLPSSPTNFENEACAKFADVMADIRGARFKTGRHDLHCQPDDMLDDRLTKKYLLAKLRKYKDMRFMLTRIIKCNEYHKLPSKKELRELMDIRGRFSYYLWLLEHRFVQRNKDGRLVATKAGIEGALESMRSDIGRAIKLDTAIFLPDVDMDMPGSLAIEYLKKHDSYSPITVDGHSCVIAWIRQDASDEDTSACRLKVDRIIEDVLGVFYSSYHSTTAEDISGKVANKRARSSAAYINAILSTLERIGRVSRDGDSWLIPMRDKIERVITKSDEALSKDEIMRLSVVAGMYKSEVDDVLAALVKNGIARKLPDGKWIYGEKSDRWMGQVAYKAAKTATIALLGRRRSGMDKDMFIDYLGSSVRKAVRGSNWREQLKRVVVQLEDDHIIELDDGMYRLAAGR